LENLDLGDSVMTVDYSKDAFFKFLDYLSDKDLIKYQTVRGWRSAAHKLMTDLSEAEEMDIRAVDLDLAIHRAANREAETLSPTSLKTYQQRVAIAINEFDRRQSDSSNYKPRGLSPGARGKKSNGTNGLPRAEKDKTRTQTGEKTTSKIVEKGDSHHQHSSSGLSLSYPLRSDFLAQVVIPRDLNTAEAKRLGAFLLTIAIDYQPE
jgi:hypothetical protein